MTEAALYSIVAGNTLVFGETVIKIHKVEGERVELGSWNHKAIKTVTEIIRWIDQGRAVVLD